MVGDAKQLLYEICARQHHSSIIRGVSFFPAQASIDRPVTFNFPEQKEIVVDTALADRLTSFKKSRDTNHNQGHLVAHLVKLVGSGKAGRTRPHDCHVHPGAVGGDARHHPALLESSLDDGVLNALDRHR